MASRPGGLTWSYTGCRTPHTWSSGTARPSSSRVSLRAVCTTSWSVGSHLPPGKLNRHRQPGPQTVRAMEGWGWRLWLRVSDPRKPWPPVCSEASGKSQRLARLSLLPCALGLRERRWSLDTPILSTVAPVVLTLTSGVPSFRQRRGQGREALSCCLLDSRTLNSPESSGGGGVLPF